MYTLRLYQDYVPANIECRQIESQHSILYVLRGGAEINGEAVAADQAVYCKDSIFIQTAEMDAVIWRWEIVREEAANTYLEGGPVQSKLAISRKVQMFELTSRSKWLFRLDCIYGNLGSTGLHSHPGSGIRCLLEGNLHVRGVIGECSDNTKTGDAWYEEGSYPIISTTYGDEPAAFLRGMILPVEYDEYPDTAMWIEGEKKVQSSWKNYSQQVIMLR